MTHYEYYIYNIPLFVLNTPEESVDIPAFCEEVEEILPQSLLHDLDVVYIGDFKELQGRNATYRNGAIYISSQEPTNFDLMEDFIHETAHSLEDRLGGQIYNKDLVDEFRGKRSRLKHILEAEGYHINPKAYAQIEYNPKFDKFLADEVGYPTLLSLTMGLFVSPYGATSLQEYFANGFEKYFLDSPKTVKDISPLLHKKIEEIINEQA